MPADTPSSTPLQCPRCGRGWRPGTTRCWLCGGDAEPVTADQAAALLLKKPERLGGYSLASLMMFVTLVAVVFGLSTISSGVGIPLGVMLLVAWWRTAAVSRHRDRSGDSLTRTQQFQVYLSSFGLAIALTVMVGVGICVALGAICFGLFAVAGEVGGGPGDQIASFAICVAAFFAALGLIWAAVKWDRYRWRRDFGESENQPK